MALPPLDPQEQDPKPPSLLTGPFASLEDLLTSLPSTPGLLRATVDTLRRRFEVFLEEGRVVALFDAHAHFSPGEVTGEDLTERPGAIFLYGQYAQEASHLEALRDAYRRSAVATGALLERKILFDGDNMGCFYEEAPTPLQEEVRGWTFLREEIPSYLEEVKAYLREEASLAEDLAVDATPWSDVGVVLEEEGEEAPKGLLGLLHLIALSDGSLQDLADGSSYTSLEILRELRQEVTAGRLRLRLEGGGTTESTWSLGALDVEPPPEDAFDEWEQEEAEEEVPQEEGFCPTPHLRVSIDADAKRLMEDHVENAASKLRLFEYLLKNASLVADVKALEGELRPITNRYVADLARLESMRMERSFEALSSDDEYEEAREGVETDPAFVALRQEANAAFFTISKLERRRHEANEGRREVLEDLMAVIPYREDDEVSVRLHKVLEEKLAGIDEVRNVAFSPTPSPAQEAPQEGRRFSPLKEGSLGDPEENA